MPKPVERPAMEGFEIPIVTTRLVWESSMLVEDLTVRTAGDAARLAAMYLQDRDREHFIVLLLSTKHVCWAIYPVSVGGLSSALVHPREVFKGAIVAEETQEMFSTASMGRTAMRKAIQYSAAAVILAHNHPSGDPQPSREDVMITEQVRAVGHLVGIEVLDHIIIGADGAFRSMRDERLGF